MGIRITSNSFVTCFREWWGGRAREKWKTARAGLDGEHGKKRHCQEINFTVNRLWAIIRPASSAIRRKLSSREQGTQIDEGEKNSWGTFVWRNSLLTTILRFINSSSARIEAFVAANYNSAPFARPLSLLCYCLFLTINRKNLISVRRIFSWNGDILDCFSAFFVANLKKHEARNISNCKSWAKHQSRGFSLAHSIMSRASIITELPARPSKNRCSQKCRWNTP